MYSNPAIAAGTIGKEDTGTLPTMVPGGTKQQVAADDAGDVLQSRVLSPEVRAAESFDDQEMVRARTWSKVLGFLCALTGCLIGIVDGDAQLKMLAQAACFVLVPVCFWVSHRSTKPNGYSRVVYRAFGWTAALSSLPVIYFLGVFSPAPLALTLGISFFGLARDPLYAWVIPLTATLGYFVLALGILLGVIPDMGMLATSVYDDVGRIFMTVMVPLVLLCSLWCAQKSRQTLVRALEQAHSSAYQAEARAFQLHEVNQEFDAVRRYGAGKSGRFSGEMAGPFRLESVVGRGAMGEVYLGYHRDNRARVAVKILSETEGCDPSNLARFLREGDMLRAVKDEHVVQVYQVGRLQGVTPAHFIAMEYLEGEDLGAVLRQEGRMTVDAVTQFLDEISTGLAAVHRAGIVHRDLKPQNLFYTTFNGVKSWKLLDFGVSKFEGSQGTLTCNQLVGTPAFMSPEQAKSIEVDARSDVFSLGAIAYRALTGRTPFAADELPGILYKIVYEHAPIPSSYVVDIPRDIERVLAVALCKNPLNRFQSAEQFREAWLEAADNRLRPGFRVRGDALMRLYGWEVS